MTEHLVTPHSAGTVGTKLRVLGLGACALFALAACAPPGSGSQPAASETAPTEVSTELGDEPVELTLYDGAGLKAKDEALIEAFTQKHPNVTITGRYDPDDVQAQNAPRVLASDDPPDIARVIALSDVAGDGLLTNLDAYADAYGWDELPEGQLAQYRVDENGVRGEGPQYTMADGFTVTGFYYNKELAEKVGMTEPPQTVEELEGLLAEAKDAGIVPIMAGNQTGQVMTTTQMLLNNALGAGSINEWVFHAPEATVDTPGAAEAVATVQDWAEAGYFPADTNGTDATGALGRFAQGEALLYASGNWDAAALDEQMGDDVGFFLPPAPEGNEPATMSDPASNFAIPAGSDAKDAAAAFLDFLRSEEARQVVADAGFAPSGEGEVPTTEEGSVKAQIQEAFARLVEADGQVQFVQNATNGLTTTWNSEVQRLVDGSTTPEDLLGAVQTKYEDELGR
ncbi:sugar ABC transporter substrate-binding protein [Kocuria dechangensis]|uniref:Sugar ABC transporter substrate-binding protein n=1 Tax=Kocuria dechangensis TaxID=1176249 RepID=A0A917H9Y4_9MICC|nr:extracellular solute-binding protein [Kocuria dechangensis]GGG71545.1 sugar ABC transporter substrate-binding protein [Kocuria dechangensis]